MGLFGGLGDFFSGFADKLGGTFGDIASVAYMPYGVTRGALSLAGNVLGGGGSAPGMPSLLAPPLPADATDEQIRAAVLAQRRRLLLGQGQGSTFISGPFGDPGALSTSKSSAGGF